MDTRALIDRDTRDTVAADAKAISVRLRILQQWAGMTDQASMAQHLGVYETRWNNALNDLGLSKDLAFRIVRRYPQITLEWLWLGNEEHMTLQTIRALQDAELHLRRRAVF